ncbi:MAG: MATE family efflux transporter [Kosmotogaceae bacterium]
MKLTRRSERLGYEPIFPLLVKLAIPSVISMTVQAMYNVIDSIYIGRLSTEALSALSLAFPIQLIIIALGAGTGIGTSSLISRLLGRQKVHEANNVAQHVLFISIFYAVIISTVGIFFTREIVSLFTDSEVLIGLTVQYIRIIMVGSIAVFIPMLFNNILRGQGNTMAPMIGLIVGAVFNIILDPFLIFGLWFFPDLGIRGAAYATIIARALSGTIVTVVLLSKDSQVRLNIKEFRFEFKIIKDLYAVALPAMVMQFVASFMIAGLNRIIGGLNTLALAVTGIYFRLQSFVLMPVFGFVQAYMPIIGYNYGHENPDRMKETMKISLVLAFTFTFAAFIIFQLFPEGLIKLFNDDPELVEIGVIALKRISYAYPVIGIAILGSTTFQAIGKGLPSLVISVMRQVGFLLPIAYVLSRTTGLEATWFAFPISEGISIIVLWIWLKKTLNKYYAQYGEKGLLK